MLRVSDNGRFLVHDDGRAFFWLGDTAWQLFHRLTREEAEEYLENRAAKRFTVIQAVVLAEHGGLTTPNANGDLAFEEGDIARPNEAYFRHIDAVVGKAASLGLHVGMLPTWGDKLPVPFWGEGPAGFLNPGNARAYGRFLGQRYAERPIVWILGGDRPPHGNEATWLALIAGLKDGDGGRHLTTWHPMGQMHSSTWWHDADWLDFNMIQSGHTRFRANYLDIASDYSRLPPKPCLDGEPGYENHPSGFDPANGYLDAADARRSAYWSLFAGAHGHTYGCNEVWQFYDRRRPPQGHPRLHWRQAIDLPGAFQMAHVRALMESRPLLSRIPDQGLILAGQRFGRWHVRCTRDGSPGQDDATYVMAYFPAAADVEVATGRIAGETVRAWWFNPRTGCADAAGETPNVARLAVRPPTDVEGEDWVLVVDDAAKGYPPPGAGSLIA